MNGNEIINELEKVESKYKDKVFATGELNIYEMVKSCKYKIQELQQENQQLKEQINIYLNNEYKLKDRLEKQRKEYQETYKDVRIEIKELKEKLKASERARKEAIELKHKFHKDNALITFENDDLIQFMNKLEDILDIDKGE